MQRFYWNFFTYKRVLVSIQYIYIYIYIYKYIVIYRQTISLYHNASVSLDKQDVLSWGRNSTDFTSVFFGCGSVVIWSSGSYKWRLIHVKFQSYFSDQSYLELLLESVVLTFDDHLLVSRFIFIVVISWPQRPRAVIYVTPLALFHYLQRS